MPVEGLRLGPFGAVICAPGASRLSYGRELAVTLAGPAVNLLAAPLLAAFARGGDDPRWYLFAGAHAALGLYNLLPILPLDGGRALYLAAAYCLGPAAGERIAAAVSLLGAAALSVLGARFMAAQGGALFLLAALGLLFGVLQQFGLAKDRLSV